MEQSILISTRNILGAKGSDVFDEDIVMFANSAFGTLYQIGVGPQGVFSITDDTDVWADFDIPADQLALVKEYIFRKAKEAFDPPATSYHLGSLEKRIAELEKRLNIMVETTV